MLHVGAPVCRPHGSGVSRRREPRKNDGREEGRWLPKGWLSAAVYTGNELVATHLRHARLAITTQPGPGHQSSR